MGCRVMRPPGRRTRAAILGLIVVAGCGSPQRTLSTSASTLGSTDSTNSTPGGTDQSSTTMSVLGASKPGAPPVGATASGAAPIGASTARASNGPASPAADSTPGGPGPGCLGHPASPPSGGWFPARGGVRPPGDAEPGTTSADSSPTLTRLSEAARAALPSGYLAMSTTEVRMGPCVRARYVRLSAPGGGKVVLDWEQLGAPRSRDAAYHVGSITWEDRADGGAWGTDQAYPDYQSVTLVIGDGRMLRISALGARSHTTSGWPTTRPLPPGPLDPAPLTAAQLRPLAEQLDPADQS